MTPGTSPSESICEWLESPDPIYWANRETLAKRIREQLTKNLQEEL